MSFPRYKGTDDFSDYTEEELNFIFGNLEVEHLENIITNSHPNQPSNEVVDDYTEEERKFISTKPEPQSYNERERDFIYGNLNVSHPVYKNQKEAILAAFERAKEESLIEKQGSKKIDPRKTEFAPNNNQISSDQQNIVRAYPPPYTLCQKNPNVARSPEAKHRHLHSFFNKLKHSKTHLEEIIPQSIYTSPIFNYSADFSKQKPYKFDERKYAQYEWNLANTRDESEARFQVRSMLVNEGCLWDLQGDANGVNSFNNLFLSSLRHSSIEAYRRIIEEQYLKQSSTKFLTGEIDLYRGDSRDYEEIFNNGFDLWPYVNLDSTPKIQYASDNGQVGISTSKNKNIAQGFGGGQLFKIHLPKNHHLLAIPFANTYEEEVNFMDNIPPEYIRSCRDISGDEIKNPKYSPDVILSPKIRRGCY